MRATRRTESASAARRARRDRLARRQRLTAARHGGAKSCRPTEQGTRRVARHTGSAETETVSPELRRAKWRAEKRRRFDIDRLRDTAEALVSETIETVRRQPPRRKILITAAVVAFFVALFALFTILPTWLRSATAPVEVKLDVVAPGLDAETGTSIPIEVEGGAPDMNGLHFVDQNGEGLYLVPGEYTISVAASPIAADGTLYSFDSEPKPVSVARKRADTSQVGRLEFSPLPEQETKRRDVNRAYNAASQGGCEADDAVKLKIVALERIGEEPF